MLIWSIVYITTLAKREIRISMPIEEDVIVEEPVYDENEELLVRIDDSDETVGAEAVDHAFNHEELKSLKVTGGVLVFGLLVGTFIILLLV